MPPPANAQILSVTYYLRKGGDVCAPISLFVSRTAQEFVSEYTCENYFREWLSSSSKPSDFGANPDQ